MINLNEISLTIQSTVKDALKIIDQGRIRIALVVNEDDSLIGTLTDGDIRRAMLNGIGLKDTIENIYCKDPLVASINDSRSYMVNLCKTNEIYQLPVLDNNGRVIRVEILNEGVNPNKYDNKVVLMVGGVGKRLRPLTNDTPKPMLHVGNRPILQTIVEQISHCGFSNIIMCVGYKSNIIQDFFGDGSKFGVNIEYIIEENKMGTVGALSLLSESQKPNKPFIVMNGDLLTSVSFSNLLDFHMSHDGEATISIKEYSLQVPYGIVEMQGEKVLSMKEKPVQKFFISAGIYVLNPSCINYIDKGKYFDINTLFEKLTNLNKVISAFPIREYWLDIGRIDEYNRANHEYHEVFNA